MGRGGGGRLIESSEELPERGKEATRDPLADCRISGPEDPRSRGAGSPARVESWSAPQGSSLWTWRRSDRSKRTPASTQRHTKEATTAEMSTTDMAGEGSGLSLRCAEGWLVGWRVGEAEL